MGDKHASFHHFHLRQIPALFAAGGASSAVLASRELEPLCLQLAASDEAYSYFPGAECIDIVAGTEAPLLLLLPGSLWADFFSNPQLELTMIGTNRSKNSSILNADFDAQQLARWQSVLQLLYKAAAQIID